MVVKNPKYHEDCEIETEDLNQLEFGRWEIDVPKVNDSLFHSIVLAALLPLAQNTDEFEKQFCILTANLKGINEKQLQDAKHTIKYINPFENKFFLKRREAFCKLVTEFRQKIFRYIRKTKNKKYFADFPHAFSTDFQLNPTMDGGKAVIQAACYMLECKITLLSSDRKMMHSFPLSDKRNSEDRSLSLTLYRETSSSDGKEIIHFSFGLDKEAGLHLQKSALERLLRKASICREKRVKIVSELQLKSDLLTSLLRHRNFGTIKALYRQRYIISKLLQAGYNVDLTNEDNYGNTGFFYAMENGDIETIRVLYDYASGCFNNWDDGSLRNPDEAILNDLEKLQAVLEMSIIKFEKQSKLKNREKQDKITFVKELIRFNRFQAALCEEILAKRKECADLADNVAEANARKHLIISILSIYEKHSNTEKQITQNENYSGAEGDDVVLDERYNSYMDYYRFYNALDISTALFFFDNIFLLKEKLSLEDGEYEKVESSLLYFIFCSSCYDNTLLSPECTGITKKRKIRNSSSSSAKELWCIITFLERMKLEECLKHFKDVLLITEAADGNTTNRLPESETKTLTSHPIIRDTFMLKRMMHYIELATEVDLEEEWQMGMLIIERALQVLGETLNIQKDPESVTIVDALLVSSFPFRMKKNITKIRNLLSHLDRKQLFARSEVEKMKDLFTAIKEELNAIKVKFTNMLHAQIFRQQKYMFQNGLPLLCQRKMDLEALRKSDIRESRKTMSSFFSLLFENRLPKMLHAIKLEDLSVDEKSVLSKLDTLEQRKKENIRQCEKVGKHEIVFKSIERDIQLSIAQLNAEAFGKEYKTNIDLLIQHIYEQLGSAKTIKNPKAITNMVNFYLTCIREVLRTLVEESGSFCEIGDLELIFIPSNDKKIPMEELKKKLENMIHAANTFYQKVIAEIKVSEETDSINCKDFPGINKLLDLLKGIFCLTEEEKTLILESESEESKEIRAAKKVLIESLEESGNILPPESAAQNIQKLVLKDSQRKELETDYGDPAMRENNLYTLKHLKDDFRNLEGKLEKNENLNMKEYNTICKALGLKEFGKELLMKVVIERRIEDRSAEFILGRIAFLLELLIKSKPDIENFWLAPKGKQATEHVKRKILWHYLQNPKLQAAVEMLLFDCMNFFKKIKDMDIFRKTKNYEHLLHKSSQLFTGINLRNVLGHGNPLLEKASELLDPRDLPYELISTALELITDREKIKSYLEGSSEPKESRSRNPSLQMVAQAEMCEYPVTPWQFDHQ